MADDELGKWQRVLQEAARTRRRALTQLDFVRPLAVVWTIGVVFTLAFFRDWAWLMLVAGALTMAALVTRVDVLRGALEDIERASQALAGQGA